MKILGVIPARGGSKGIPKKNIKLLNGKPLISYTIEAALASNLNRVIVSTDCEEIAGVSKHYGVEVMMRPSHLAEDKTPTLPVLQDVVAKLEEKYDAVMTLQPTSPLRTVEDINKSIEIFASDSKADSLVSVVEVPHNYMPEKLMDFDGKYISGNSQVKRRQEVSNMYARNGAAIYITKTEKLSEYIFGGKVLPYFMSKTNSFDIDDMEDWEIVERFI
ncbi:acylneuraminate cytidylyltransferase family protein [Aliarcobacter cryaerophilus]|uniref:acylneuraminate cytidylyltransferase family protein n=1 Tax=Aliarcobacter cryaerophilus TaxID=28198 RepID=UPI00317F3D27